MGKAHIQINHQLYEEIRQQVQNKTIPLSILSATDFGDGTMFVLIETPLLRDGFHGLKALVWRKDTLPPTIWFGYDNDV